ncbi:MAG TPA: hypothetical protein VGI39_44580 [Polyangiaceae bacterium]|jgi:hypothetical protein
MAAAEMGEVWVFNGANAGFPSAIFSTRESAERWIEARGLTGTLTWYPVDESAYDWAIRNDRFTPKKEAHRTAEFIAKFSSTKDHYHYEGGSLVG